MRLTEHIRIEFRGADVETWPGLVRELAWGIGGAVALIFTGSVVLSAIRSIATLYGWR